MFDKPITMPVEDVLKNHFFDIPRYQRPFVWTEDDVIQLIEDIESSQEGYFIGTAIFCKSKNLTYAFDIVDGQQRLTTISIIISTLIDLYTKKPVEGAEYADSKLRPLIEGKIWHNSKIQEIRPRLDKSSLNEILRGFFAQEIVKFTPPVKIRIPFEENQLNKEAQNLRRIRQLICSELENRFNLSKARNKKEEDEAIDKLEKFTKKLLQANILTIAANDFNEAYTIFKTLNSRGQSLSLDDLIKSSLLQHLKEGVPLDPGKYNWSDIVRNLESSKSVTPRLNTEDFFYHSWTTRGKEVRKKSTFYSEFDRAVSKTNAQEVMQEFATDSKIYELIFSGREIYKGRHKNVDASLKNLRRFGVTQYAPFMLLLIRYYLENKKGVNINIINNAVSILENFHFMYNAVTKSPGNRISKIYPRMTNRLLTSSNRRGVSAVIQELKQELIALQPSRDEFVAEFENIIYFNEKNISENNRRLNDIARYTLEKIYEHRKYHTFGKSFSTLTIEHIVPQSQGSRRSNNANRYIGTIGNLIFLTEEDNNSLGNADLSSKKSYFIDNGIEVPDFVIKNNFTKDSIQSRNIELAIESYDKIWRLENIS